MERESRYQAIYRDVAALPAYSEHEHHLPDSFFAGRVSLDELLNHSYVAWTGHRCDGSDQSRRRLLETVQANTYFIWFQRGLRQVHGIQEDISQSNWPVISAQMEAIYARDPDFHWRSLRENGYERLVLDTYWDPGEDGGHPEIFSPTFRIDEFMYGFHREALGPLHNESFALNKATVWSRYGFAGKSLDDFVDLMRQIITTRRRQGRAVALKCAEAYNRHICFVPDDRSAALDAFGRHPDTITAEQRIALGNYIFHRCCELAAELELPFQIHTGLAQLGGSQPMNLEPIIAGYPKVRFVLFHSGYPWVHQAAGLAHNYGNVISSLTWTPMISTSAAVTALHSFLDVSHSCGDITWGSDCWVPEESVGALLAWRHVVAKVLSERLADGLLSPAGVQALAGKLMHENCRAIYGPA